MARNRLDSGRKDSGRNYQPVARSYEMDQFSPPGSNSDSQDFNLYGEVSRIQNEIKAYGDLVGKIERDHAARLNTVNEADADTLARDLDRKLQEANRMGSNLKNDIYSLKKQPIPANQRVFREQQVSLLTERLREALGNFQRMELDARQKQKDRFERQYKIINPGADQRTIDDMLTNPDTQVFSDNLLRNNSAQASAARRQVTERREDVQRIERALAELAQLFTDLNSMLEQQDEIVDNIEAQAESTQKDAEAGMTHLGKAVDSARAARKKRWICFFITVIILIIVGVVAGCEISQQCTVKSSGKQ